MSDRRLSDEFFQNKVEQNQIKEALIRAIPENVYYHNLIIALAEMLHDAAQQAFKEDVFTRSIHDKPKSEVVP